MLTLGKTAMKTLAYPRVLAAKIATFDLSKLERGDSDTSASTIRTAGAVFLVVVVVAGIIGAVTLIGNRTAGKIGKVSW
jgi:hypothetical protein